MRIRIHRNAIGGIVFSGVDDARTAAKKSLDAAKKRMCSSARHMALNVGASAKAFGQGIGDVDKEVFKKDVNRVRPSKNALCNSVGEVPGFG